MSSTKFSIVLQVRLHLLTAVMKCFFKRPPETQKALGATLAAGISDTHQVRIAFCFVLYYSNWIFTQFLWMIKKIVALAKLYFVAGCSWQSTFLLQAFAIWSFCSRTCSKPSQTSCICICRYTEQWNERSDIWWVQQPISCVSEGMKVCDNV